LNINDEKHEFPVWNCSLPKIDQRERRLSLLGGGGGDKKESRPHNSRAGQYYPEGESDNILVRPRGAPDIMKLSRTLSHLYIITDVPLGSFICMNMLWKPSLKR